MPVFRVIKNDNYTVMSNYHLRDKQLSLKAKGLLSFMLSLPDNWDYSLNGLESVLLEKETAIKTALDELKERKYLRINKERNSKGLYEYHYNIYEYPYYPEVENPEVDIPEVDIPAVENQTQINTNKINTNKKDICSLSDDFDKLWSIYPRKDGKATAFKHYKAWVNGKDYAGKKEKLENREMWYAIKIYDYYLKENKTEAQYIKMGSTFFNDSIFEYAMKYRKSPDYWNEKIREQEIKYGDTQ